MPLANRVAVSQAALQESYRLIELPSDLAELLESDAAPRLEFKSAIERDGTLSAAVLCTQNKTYCVRQVQTSNSVFIARPTHDSQISLVSQCKSYIELSDQKQSIARADLEGKLSVWTDQDSIPHTGPSHQLFKDICASEKECLVAWTESMAFEMVKDGSTYSYCPSLEAKLKAWTLLIAGASEHEINLTEPIEPADLESCVVSEQTDALLHIARAIVKYLSTTDPDTVDDLETTYQLDESKTLVWTGAALLETCSPVAPDDFLSRWKDMLPEDWRDRTEMSILTQHYKRLPNGMIGYKSPADEPTQSTADTNPTKRKWHEKFKQARKR